MLQIPPKCCKFYGKWEVPTPKCCKTVEMAASSSKILQIARKTGRKNRSKKTSQNRKNIIPKTILDPIINKQHLWIQWQVLAWSQPSLPLACGCLVLPKPSSKFQEQRRSKLLPVGKLRIVKLERWGHGYHLQGFARDIEILSNLLDTGCGYMRSPCSIHGYNGGMETMSSCAPYECVGSPCDRYGRYGRDKYGLLGFPNGFLMVWSCHAMPWWNSGRVFGYIPQDISIPEIPTFVSSSPIPKITIPNTTRNV